MPVNPALRQLARDGRFSVDDARTLQQLVQRGDVTKAEAKEALQRYGEVMDPEAGRLLESFTGGSRNQAFAGVPAELQGRTLRSGSSGGDVETLQRALMSLGMRDQNAGFTMPSGVDGKFGSETANAVRAFQTANNIRATGVATPETLRALDRALRGEQATTSTPPSPPSPTTPRPRLGLQQPTAPVPAQSTSGPATPAAVVNAAEGLVNGPHAQNYGVPSGWVNNDPRHAAPTDRPVNGTVGRWKCNLFAGNTLAAAGFEPPYYGNRRTGGEYPNANQLYKWSDRYAGRFGNANNVRFHLRDEVRDMPKLSDADRRAQVGKLLEQLKPGDLLIADHLGDAVSDGGHCRVFLGRDDQGNYRFAQAGSERAEVRAEHVDNLLQEEHLWILQPNTPRR